MNDGTRTHDDRNHNPGLYQLSYAHHNLPELTNLYGQLYGTPDRTRTCNLRLSLPATVFTAPTPAGLESSQSRFPAPHLSPGLWSGLYLHHFRWDTYSLYGSPLAAGKRATRGFPRYCHRLRILKIIRSVKVSPIQCPPLYGFLFPAKAPVRHSPTTSRGPALLKGRCSIQLSYGRNG